MVHRPAQDEGRNRANAGPLCLADSILLLTKMDSLDVNTNTRRIEEVGQPLFGGNAYWTAGVVECSLGFHRGKLLFGG
jgi:hypothetical protein